EPEEDDDAMSRHSVGSLFEAVENWGQRRLEIGFLIGEFWGFEIRDVFEERRRKFVGRWRWGWGRTWRFSAFHCRCCIVSDS
ncbi:hypothetical protein PanWU01x14_165950, partial [Parasponia andersonii]